MSSGVVYAEEGSTTITLDVQRAEQLAVSNSPEIRVIRYQQAIRRMVVQENWRAYLPEAGVSWTRNSTIVENESDTQSQRLILSLDQVVFDGGRRDLSLQAALSDLALSKYDYLLRLNDLKFGVRSLFYSILAARARIKTLELSIERQGKQLEFARAELDLGESTKLEVLEIENRLNEITLQKKSAEIEASRALRQLKLQLRVPQEVSLNLEGDLLREASMKFESLESDPLIARALQRRVEIERSKAAQRQATANYEIAKSYYVPTISVGGFYGFSGDRYPPREREYGFNFKITMLLGPNSFNDTGSASISRDGGERGTSGTTTLNIMDRMDYRREIVRTGVNAYEAKVERENTREQIKIQVEESLADYQNSWQALELADENINLFDQRIQISELQLELGDITRTDFAETEIRYLEAKTAQIEARLRYLRSVMELELALGIEIDSLGLVSLTGR